MLLGHKEPEKRRPYHIKTVSNTGTFQPSVSSCATRYSLLADVPGYLPLPERSCLQLLEQCYATHEAGEGFAALRQRLLTKLQSARKRLRNTVASLQSQLDACMAHEEVKKRADLLMANVYRYVEMWTSCMLTWMKTWLSKPVKTDKMGVQIMHHYIHQDMQWLPK